MKKLDDRFLNKSERASLEALQRIEKDRRLSDRVRMILLLDSGWSYEKIATAFFLDRTTVRRYYQIYTQSGKEGLVKMHWKKYKLM